MASEKRTILLFGDYTDPWAEAFGHVTLQAASSPWLQTFLDRVAAIVSAETQQMDGALRESLCVRRGPPTGRAPGVLFSSLADLADARQNGGGGDGDGGIPDDVGFVDAVMVYVVRAVALLGWVRQNPDALRAGPLEALGISGGLFNASVLAVARDWESLYEASLVVAGLVCRHCRLAWTRSREVEDSSCSYSSSFKERDGDSEGDGGASWGWTVTGISSGELDAALVEFQETMGVPTYKRARVGIRGDRWSTVIGPPSVLSMCFEQCPRLRTGVGKKPLAIRTLQHNPGWKYSRAELDYIVGTSSSLVDAVPCPGFGGLWGLQDLGRRHATWGDLLREVVDAAFSRPVDVQELAVTLASTLTNTGSISIDIGVMGDTCHESYLVKTLRAGAGAGATTHPLTLTVSKFGPTAAGSGSLDASESESEGDAQIPPGRIAVVGMGGRGPDSTANDSLDQFWDIIRQGHDVARNIFPEDRFDAASLFPPHSPSSSPSSPCRSSTDYACLLRDPGHFDASFFRLSPREATLLDPCSRLFLMAAYTAVEMSGYSAGPITRTVDPARIAVLYGQSNEDGYMTSHHERGCDAYTLQTVQRAFAPGRVAHHFGWEGPTWSIDSACSTSSSLLHLATRLLLDPNKDVDMVVAGASNVISSPHGWCALSKSGVLSATGNCKSFRADADGYCRGEFVGAVVLKRLEDAVAHNDHVLAVIGGSGKNQSGNAPSITTPDAGAQERLFRRVLRAAGVAPAGVSYVEAHGTGTPVGDPCEVSAIAGALARRRRPGSSVQDDDDAEERLAVGAVKANIGHSEAASGIASLIKGVFMFRHQLMPPQAGMPHALHPALPPLLARSGITIPSTSCAFKSQLGKPRRILLNNVDAAGGNACLLLEDPAGFLPRTRTTAASPEQDTSSSSAGSSHHVVAISARTHASFHENKRRLLRWIKANKNSAAAVRLADVAYTTTARRIHHHPFRFACAASSTSDLIESLEKDLARTDDDDNDVDTPHATTGAAAGPFSSAAGHKERPPVVWVFSGQGSEYAGMGSELYRASPVFRDTVDRCVQLCAEQGFPSFSDIIMVPHDDNDDVDTENSSSSFGAAKIVEKQLALVTLELALAAFWRHAGIEPSLVIGHSLGEYAALHAAGVLSLADTLHLVGHRARRLLAVCEPGACGMLAVSAGVDTVRAFLDDDATQRQGQGREGGVQVLFPSCTVACVNGPNACVVSGTTADLVAAGEALGREGIRSQRLARVAYGFHSAQMDAVAPDLERLAAAVSFSPPRVPLASTLLASVVEASHYSTSKRTIDHSYLARQTRCPVDFVGAVKAAHIWLGEQGNRAVWLEMGPRGVCASLVRSILKSPVSGRASTAVVVSTLQHHKNASGWSSVCSCLADLYTHGVEVDWLRLYASRQEKESLQLLTVLPSYAWDVQDYWIKWTEKRPPENSTGGRGLDNNELLRMQMHYTCAQHLIDKSETQVTFRSRLAHPALKQIIDGHRVQGTPVCPGSVYCDAALAAAAHVLGWGEQSNNSNNNNNNNNNNMDTNGLRLALADIALIRPLTERLVGVDGDLLIQATLHDQGANKAAAGAGAGTAPQAVSVSFKASSSGSSPAGGRQITLGTCTVTAQDPAAVQAAWERTHAYYVKARMDAVTQNAKAGRGHWLQPAVFYALLSRTFAYHDERFKAVAEAFVAPDFQDATARVVLSSQARHDGSSSSGSTRFISSPYWGEALVHLAGFLVNCHPDRSSSSTISIMHSIGRIERVAALEAGKAYTTYARVCTRSADTSNCDVFVFDSAGSLVFTCLDMCFRELSATVMAQVLASSSLSSSSEEVPSRGHDVLKTKSHAAAAIVAPALSSPPFRRAAEIPTTSSTVAHQQQVMNNLEVDSMATTREKENRNGAVAADTILQSIAKETGCPVSRLTDDQGLVELGVDSIMAIEITSSVKADTGYDLAPSVLLQCRTIGHLRSHLHSLVQCGDTVTESPSSSHSLKAGSLTPPTPRGDSDSDSDPDRLPSPSLSPSASPLRMPEVVQDDALKEAAPALNRPTPTARVTLLRKCGNKANNNTHRLYLMADGFGSVSSYVHLVAHRFSADLYGIDSPYLGCPEQLTPEVGIEHIASLAVDALLQQHPQIEGRPSPFILGGFSGGGILAYEMARQLSAAGRPAQGLLIIDMRCPLPRPAAQLQIRAPSSAHAVVRVVPPDVVQNLTNHTFALTTVGGWNPDAPKARHLLRFLDTVGRYSPPPPPTPLRVPTAIVWCEKGMITHLQRHPDLLRRTTDAGVPLAPFPGFMQDPQLGHLLWSLLHKTSADLGPNGWDKYVTTGAVGSSSSSSSAPRRRGEGDDGNDILCLSVDANHQEILQPAYARKTAEAIEKALVFFLAHGKD